MATIASRLLNSGTLLTAGSFDEVTFNTSSTVVKNLFDTSNNFAYSGYDRTITTNATTAPDGTRTATLVQELSDGSATFHGISLRYKSVPDGVLVAGTRYTISIYIKNYSSDRKFIFGLGPQSFFGNNLYGYGLFDPTTGTAGLFLSNGGSPTSSMVNCGNGWYRCILSVTPTITFPIPPVNPGMDMQLTNMANSNQYVGNGTSGLYVWGGQLEAGSTATVYQPTSAGNITTVPFVTKTATDAIYATNAYDEVTYNKTTPIIKNLLTYTETFPFDWTLNSGNIVANAITAPDGKSLAPKLCDSSTFGNQRIYAKPATTDNTTYTFSLYLKPAERYIVRCYFEDIGVGGGGRVGQYLNLNTGTVILTYQTGTNTLLGSNLENVGNGWWRYSWTVKTVKPSNRDADVYIIIAMGDATQSFSYQGDGISGMYIWGAQMEVANSVTSYQGVSATNTLIAPLFTKRDDKTGNVYVTKEYDEWSGVPITDGAILYVDSALSTSYTQGSTTWTNIANTSASGTIGSTPGGGNATQLAPTSDDIGFDPATMSLLINDNRNSLNGQIRFPGIDYNALALTNNFTVMFAAKRDYYGFGGNFIGNCEFFQAANQGYNSGWRIQENSQGVMGAPFNATPRWSLEMSPAAVPAGWNAVVDDTSPNRWCIVAFSVSPTNVYAFCNGNITTRTNPLTYASGSPNRGYINFTSAGGGSFNGKLGFFMVFNRALSTTELTYNYNVFRNRYGL